jgi:N-acetylmuramic acid 6-phosphate etherase
MPTFAWSQERLGFIIVGGESAFAASAERRGRRCRGCNQTGQCCTAPAVRVIAVSAIGTTPFTVAALHQVGVCQAITIGVANNPGAALLTSARYPVPVETGRELIAGSTRMKAGTARKVVLNLISTGIMLRLGRVYRGMMVNMQTTNTKLKRRAEVMIARIAGCSQADAASALEQTEGDIKMAALVVLGYDKAEAEGILASHNGNLSRVFADLPNDRRSK